MTYISYYLTLISLDYMASLSLRRPCIPVYASQKIRFCLLLFLAFDRRQPHGRDVLILPYLVLSETPSQVPDRQNAKARNKLEGTPEDWQICSWTVLCWL